MILISWSTGKATCMHRMCSGLDLLVNSPCNRITILLCKILIFCFDFCFILPKKYHLGIKLHVEINFFLHRSTACFYPSPYFWKTGKCMHIGRLVLFAVKNCQILIDKNLTAWKWGNYFQTSRNINVFSRLWHAQGPSQTTFFFLTIFFPRIKIFMNRSNGGLQDRIGTPIYTLIPLISK